MLAICEMVPSWQSYVFFHVIPPTFSSPFSDDADLQMALRLSQQSAQSAATPTSATPLSDQSAVRSEEDEIQLAIQASLGGGAAGTSATPSGGAPPLTEEEQMNRAIALSMQSKTDEDRARKE